MSAASVSPQDCSPIDEMAELRLDLWSARDAAIGAVAQAGSLRARNRELEAQIHQLRGELERLRRIERSKAFRIGSGVTRPLAVARRLLR